MHCVFTIVGLLVYFNGHTAMLCSNFALFGPGSNLHACHTVVIKELKSAETGV